MQEIQKQIEPEYGDYKGYLGNKNIKKSGVSVAWSQELMQEYLRCAEDPIYFIENYMKIINVDEGLITFKPYDYQKEMIESMTNERRTIITTCRQAGKTTAVTGFILHYIIFNTEKTVALLANRGETAREILGKVQMAYQHLPKWLQQGVVEWNKGSFVLENGSRVLAGATSSDSIRGYAINLLFIDEAAFIENWDEFFTSVFPTVSSGKTTKVVLVSTPNGLNHFYALWANALEERNGYNAIRVTWQSVPGRDEKWKEETLASMNFDIEKFNQEYEAEFLGSSGTLISGAGLKSLVHKDPLVRNEGLATYINPEAGRKYVLIADTSRGKGLDYSAFQVIDVTEMPYNQVCVYRNNVISPGDYSDVLFRVATAYNRATVLLEINDLGAQVADILYESFEYENLLFTENSGRAGKRISSGFGNKVDKGINTSKSVKATGCALLKLLIEQHQLILNDAETISELKTFSRKANSYEAETGRHDDLVICLVLFAWLSEDRFFKEFTDINTLMELREKSDDDLMSELTPFGFIVDGREEEDAGHDLNTHNPMRSAWALD